MLKQKGKWGKKSLWDCDVCGKTFEVENRRATDAVKKGQRKSCNKVCGGVIRIKNSHNFDEYYKNNQHPMRGNGCGITTDGYIWIYVKGKFNNQIKLHRYLMEIKVGRELTAEEIVHHIDEDKLNNTIENLEIHTRRSHNQIHGTFRRIQAEKAWSDEEMADMNLDYKDFVKKHGNRRTKGALGAMRHRTKHNIMR